MTKFLTSMIAATLVGALVLTTAILEALAFKRTQQPAQVGQSMGMRQRFGQNMQSMASHAWQGMQSSKARLTSSAGGFLQIIYAGAPPPGAGTTRTGPSRPTRWAGVSFRARSAFSTCL